MNPAEHIADVLDRIDKTPRNQIREPLPHHWKNGREAIHFGA